MKDLVIVVKGRLDLRGKEMYLNNRPLLDALWEYAGGEVTICISKERKARRMEILKEIFTEEQPNE